MLKYSRGHRRKSTRDKGQEARLVKERIITFPLTDEIIKKDVEVEVAIEGS